jgi:uncharacterized membrane protein
MAFVMVQFGATAYSPRLVLWVSRDPVMTHALGIFTGTFLYAIAALASVDRNGSGQVPALSLWLVVSWLVASVAMLIALIKRISSLQVTRMLAFIGDQGRQVIASTYPSAIAAPAAAAAEDFRARPRTQTLQHRGSPYAIQAVDVEALVSLATSAGGVIELVVAVGDTVVESMPLLHVFGAQRLIEERSLLEGIEIGEARTFEQDPKYPLRLLVDIAIRALSPAINDPTTAAQALDQIEDLLLRLGRRDLAIGSFRDRDGVLRLVMPCPTWDDLLGLAFEEICACGGTSMQIMRRMNAVIGDLLPIVPDERRSGLLHWADRIQAIVTRSFAAGEEQRLASVADRQGLGVPNPPSPE